MHVLNKITKNWSAPGEIIMTWPFVSCHIESFKDTVIILFLQLVNLSEDNRKNDKMEWGELKEMKRFSE